jgi:HK97 family phage major capsid protein
MEKLFKMLGAMIALMNTPVEERDEKAVRKLNKDFEAFIDSDEAKGLGNVTTEFKAEFDQLKKDHEESVKTVAELKRMGLGSQRGGIILPSGKSARLQMLADGRCFMSDETAKRFGAHAAVQLARSGHAKLREDALPQYTRDLAKDVEKTAGELRAKADVNIDPDTSGSGSELVSDEFRAELIRNVEAVGTAYPLLRRVPLGTWGTTTYPKRTAGLTAYPTALGSQITQSGITFETVQLSPEQWGTLTGVPLVMFSDPGLLADLGNLIGVEIVYAMAYAFDNCVVNGDGTATYGGITGMLQSANVTAVAPTADHDAIAEIDETDISEIIAGLTADYAHADAQWLLSLSIKSHLRNIRSTTGMPIFDRGNGDREPATIDGYPYQICQRMPAAAAAVDGGAFALFGDFRKAMYFGMIRDIQIATSEHVWFDQAMVAIRGLAYVDAAEADADAVIEATVHA